MTYVQYLYWRRCWAKYTCSALTPTMVSTATALVFRSHIINGDNFPEWLPVIKTRMAPKGSKLICWNGGVPTLYQVQDKKREEENRAKIMLTEGLKLGPGRLKLLELESCSMILPY